MNLIKTLAAPQWARKIDKPCRQPQVFPMSENDPLIIHDGRQSETAAAVARGAGRLLRQANYVPISEFVLPTGRRVDLIALDPAGSVLIVEVKSSVADFRADQKWTDYREFCDLMYFAIPPEVPQDLIPPDTGLICADAWGAAFLRHPQRVALTAQRRKAITLQYARAAAQRLHAIHDPNALIMTP